MLSPKLDVLLALGADTELEWQLGPWERKLLATANARSHEYPNLPCDWRAPQGDLAQALATHVAQCGEPSMYDVRIYIKWKLKDSLL